MERLRIFLKTYDKLHKKLERTIKNLYNSNSTPLLDKDGKVVDLSKEKKSRNLCKDLRKLYNDFKSGNIFFSPPTEWMDFDDFESILEDQGVLLLPMDGSDSECNMVRNSPLFFLNFIGTLKSN